MRYDERRGVYRDCKWCAGGGCLYCKSERDKDYAREFPGGPQVVTFDISTPEGLKRARRAIGPDALKKAFGPDGRGFAEVVENAASAPSVGEEEG